MLVRLLHPPTAEAVLGGTKPPSIQQQDSAVSNVSMSGQSVCTATQMSNRILTTSPVLSKQEECCEPELFVMQYVFS